MAIYAIGDIQGCFDDLQILLERIRFDPAIDQLWFAGDLVNRGPDSLAVLRFVRDLGDRAVTVLGNHDLHLLAVWQDPSRLKESDTLDAVLEAADADTLLEWLRRRPLMHYSPTLHCALLHAGLPPQWDLTTALACAREVEAALGGPDFAEFMHHLYGNKPRQWDPNLTGWDRLRFAVNCFTRLRFCDAEGRLNFAYKGPPGEQAEGEYPWYQAPGRRSSDVTLVFGHWSTLGLHLEDNVRALDTGCLWGGRLTALRLDSDEQAIISVPCPGARKPG